MADNTVTETVVVKAEDVLNDIVAVTVLSEYERVTCNLLDELYELAVGCVVHAALQDPGAMTISSDLNAVLGDGVVDELNRMKLQVNAARRGKVYTPGCPRGKAS